jgi:hypothetical protein
VGGRVGGEMRGVLLVAAAAAAAAAAAIKVVVEVVVVVVVLEHSLRVFSHPVPFHPVLPC